MSRFGTLFLGLFAAVLLVRTAWSAEGEAILSGTQPGSAMTGTVRFEETKEGLKVTANIQNAPPGQHAFHVHEYGLCDDLGKAAGDHYNPYQAKHGFVPKEGPHLAHAGDLGNIEIGPDGKGSAFWTIPEVTLGGGKAWVAGRAMILHEKVDQFTQPLGNAGGRIACGPIHVVKS